jgi:two-component system cell cycle response regulator/two-component system cell cycle response regulator DivK
MTGERVLIVDDNPVNLRLVEAALKGAGHEVHGATDSSSALEAVTSLNPRLILMDLQLPGMDGLELTRRLKADPATKDIPIVATTAYAMAGDEAKARQAGCDGYLAKPIDVLALPGVVSEYLAGAHGNGRHE